MGYVEFSGFVLSSVRTHVARRVEISIVAIAEKRIIEIPRVIKRLQINLFALHVHP